MSAGCIKSKAERLEIVSRGLAHLEAAVAILKTLPDPDKDARKFEEAVGFVLKAMGPDYPNRYDDEFIGFEWLMEHYFS